MGLIGKVLGAGNVAEAVKDVAEVFRPNATAQMEGEQAAYLAALAQLGAEFAQAQPGWFDRFVNGLNRLPRPALALGTLALFVYAMVAPSGFAARMEGLQAVPEPLWWLLGAIVSFYFGAREAHYFRLKLAQPAARRAAPEESASPENPALAELLRLRAAG